MTDERAAPGSALAELWAGVDLPERKPVRARSAWKRDAARATPYLLLAPAAILLAGISLYPLLYSVQVSLQRRIGEQPGQWSGLDNYERLLSDDFFWNALKVTAIFAGSAVTVELLLGLGLALVVASRDTPLLRRLRVVYLLPMMVAPVAVGIIWRLIYASETGAFPTLASAVGIDDFDVLSSESLALPALVLVDVWQWTPFMFLILLAGIQSLPQEPFEAARVDGASRARVLFTITLPMLRPIILVAIVVRAIDAFAIFDQVFVLTRGGPGNATQTLGIYAYSTAFKFSQIGYAAAIVFCMVATLALICAVLIRALRGRTVAA